MTTRQAEDTYERHVATLERLLAERGVGRYATFSEVGEGTFFPDGTEDASGFVVDQHGRVFFYWTGWDAERDAVVFSTWKQVAPEPGWERDPEYQRARAAVRLG